MSMTKKERDELGAWLVDVFQKNGPLITQRHAACILGISDNSVRIAGESGRLTLHKCGKVKMYSFMEVLALKARKAFDDEAIKAGKNKNDFVKENLQKAKEYAENLSDEEIEKHLKQFEHIIENSMEMFFKNIDK